MTTYVNLGHAPAFGGQCEAWVELQLLGHTGAFADPLDAMRRAGDFRATNDPNAVPPDVAVVFGPAASNEGLGHSGVSEGGGRMRSVWSDGSVEDEPIAQFSADNGAPLLGYHNFGRGTPAAGGAATGGRANRLPPAVLVFGGLAALLVGDELLDWLFG